MPKLGTKVGAYQHTTDPLDACEGHDPKAKVETTIVQSWGREVHATRAFVGAWPSEATETANRMARMIGFGRVGGSHSNPWNWGPPNSSPIEGNN